MPRKQRIAKRRLSSAADVSDALFLLLTWDDLRAASAAQQRDGSDKWEIVNLDGNHEVIWKQIEADALRAWTATYPGTRPRSWWLYSAVELRQVHGSFIPGSGRHRCHDSGVPHGEPGDWTDRPLVETTPSYLDRLRLWLPGERARVPADAFDPQPFSWALIHAPNYVPDDDDDEAGPATNDDAA